MRKLSIFALVILSASAHAQGVSSTESMPIYKESSAMAPTLWFKVGPGFSSIHADDLEGASTRTALSLGAEIEMPMTESFSLQTGLNYIQKGLSVNVPGPNGQNIRGTLALNYLELPFLAKAKIPMGSSNFALMAGPYAALALTRSSNAMGQTVDLADFT